MLGPPTQRPQPQALPPVAKDVQEPARPRDGEIVEPALTDPSKPLAGNTTSPLGVTSRPSIPCRSHTPWYDGWVRTPSSPYSRLDLAPSLAALRALVPDKAKRRERLEETRAALNAGKVDDVIAGLRPTTTWTMRLRSALTISPPTGRRCGMISTGNGACRSDRVLSRTPADRLWICG